MTYRQRLREIALISLLLFAGSVFSLNLVFKDSFEELPPAVCGDGIISPGETCDPPGTCPVSCDDADVCTADTLTGDAQQCTAECVFTPLGCVDDDGCCAPGCNAGNDTDC